MNALKRCILLTMLCVIAALPHLAAPQERERVLVLGFDAPFLNDLQDRLLREQVMKELIKRGYAVVPVMQVESLVLNVGIAKIRKPANTAMKEYCLMMDADIALTGKLREIKGPSKKVTKTASEEMFSCTMNVYVRKKEKWATAVLNATGNDDLYLFITELSKEITRTAESLMAQ